jgi:hypothetical protein
MDLGRGEDRMMERFCPCGYIPRGGLEPNISPREGRRAAWGLGADCSPLVGAPYLHSRPIQLAPTGGGFERKSRNGDLIDDRNLLEVRLKGDRVGHRN